MYLDFSALSANQVYHTIIQSIIPRPIAWVLTENDNASFNLAPFSYFTAVSSNPPLLMFSVGKKADSNNKDTAYNIRKRESCVIHIAHAELANELNQSAANLEYNESELSSSSLNTEEFDQFHLPRIKEAKIAFACSLYEIQEIGNTPMNLIFAKIEHAYVADEIIESDGVRSSIDAEKLNPLARLGGNDYAEIATPFTIGRPK